MIRRLGWMVFVFALTGTMSVEAVGQQRYSPPSGATAPSALNLFRFDSRSPRNLDGIVQQSQNLNSQVQGLAARQQADFRATKQAISQLREVEAAPTGVGAGFMNYSHYYPMRQNAGRSTRR